MTADDAREKIGGLLDQQVTMLTGISGLISSDAAAAVEHLAIALAQFVEQEDYE